ncbi:hypothetical protein D4765_11745 [Subtercola vilae]|uniref:Uncharacterized protein n=1 Tax=Subtercola vilae TaxID=2056433 RepID=A0A4T2BUD0_9MICO|nr:hypothetical protein D4765_11745 [Subtercola vilae]
MRTRHAKQIRDGIIAARKDIWATGIHRNIDVPLTAKAYTRTRAATRRDALEALVALHNAGLVPRDQVRSMMGGIRGGHR